MKMKSMLVAVIAPLALAGTLRAESRQDSAVADPVTAVFQRMQPGICVGNFERDQDQTAVAELDADYLDSIRSAGFRDVGIAGESAFPVSCFATDPLVQRVIEEASLPPGAIGELEGSVASIKVYGRKP